MKNYCNILLFCVYAFITAHIYDVTPPGCKLPCHAQTSAQTTVSELHWKVYVHWSALHDISAQFSRQNQINIRKNILDIN